LDRGGGGGGSDELEWEYTNAGTIWYFACVDMLVRTTQGRWLYRRMRRLKNVPGKIEVAEVAKSGTRDTGKCRKRPSHDEIHLFGLVMSAFIRFAEAPNPFWTDPL
jgi:hypothetical protein